MPVQDNRLFVGGNFAAYLFFELPVPGFNAPLQSAKVVLFKLPVCERRQMFILPCGNYTVRPLLDFFSPYSNCYTAPRQDEKLAVTYMDNSYAAYTEIDVMPIVREWLKNQPENKGLAITGREASVLTYASAFYAESGMRPFLRLIYKEITPPLNCTADTIVTVQEPAEC